MLRWLMRLALNGAALLVISYWFETIQVASYSTAIIAAFILGLVNTLVRPILLFLTMPLKFLTIGTFWFVINAVTFSLTAALIDGFEIGQWPESIWTTILAAAAMSFLGWLIDIVLRKEKK
ncbi:MAG TPA: phage holin family protein [Candidatus Bathyarchaeia archaeon]|nr:phage holin family protein [Candidatus Bathyarchaeia archaeon]